MDLIYASIQYNRWNTLIKCATFLQVDYLQIAAAFNKPLISNKISENYKRPTQYLFLTMYPSTNTLYGSIENINISTEATTITTSPSPYVKKT